MSAFAGVSAFADIWSAGQQYEQERKVHYRTIQNVAQMRRQTAIRVKNIERAGRLAVGSQRAAYSKSGVTLQGSPLEVLVETSEDAREAAHEEFVAGKIAAKQKEDEANERRKIAKSKVFLTFLGSAAKAGGSAA